MTSRNPKAPRPSAPTPKAQQPHTDDQFLKLYQITRARLVTAETDLDAATALLTRVRNDERFTDLDSTLQTDISNFLS